MAPDYSQLCILCQECSILCLQEISRSYMVLFGPVWSHMVPYGPVWSHMVLYGPLFPCMASYETVYYVCFVRVTCGALWFIYICLVPQDSLWSNMVSNIKNGNTMV